MVRTCCCVDCRGVWLIGGWLTEKKKLKTVVTAQPSTSDKVVVESVVDTERTFDDESEWPLERFCAELFIDLFE